jgi:hypothetical protein
MHVVPIISIVDLRHPPAYTPSNRGGKLYRPQSSHKISVSADNLHGLMGVSNMQTTGLTEPERDERVYRRARENHVERTACHGRRFAAA